MWIKLTLLLPTFIVSTQLTAQVGPYLKAPSVVKGDPLIVEAQPSNLDVDKPVGIQQRVLLHKPDRSTVVAPIPKVIEADSIILTSGTVKLAYYRYNPLRVQATVATKDVDDPGHAALLKLLEGLKSFATARGIPAADARPAGGCGAGSLSDQTKAAEDILKSIKISIGNWNSAVRAGFESGQTGPAVMGDLIDNQIGRVVTAVSTCKQSLDRTIDAKKGGATASADESTVLAAAVKMSVALGAAQTSLESLVEGLAASRVAEHWTDPGNQSFVISEDIEATQKTAKAVTVTIKILSRTSTDGVVSITDKGSSSVTFTARHAWLLLPAPSAGLVVGFIDRPKYSVKQNTSGQNVVNQNGFDKHTLDAAVMCNFISRANVAGIAPMLQAGVSPSKDLPSLLGGGGFRLFGLPKGDFSVAGGLMVGWYKDLNKLKVGDVVASSDDLNNDLTFRTKPKVSGYFMVQYSF